MRLGRCTTFPVVDAIGRYHDETPRRISSSGVVMVERKSIKIKRKETESRLAGGVEQRNSFYFLPVTLNVMTAGVAPLGVLTVVPADAKALPD